MALNALAMVMDAISRLVTTRSQTARLLIRPLRGHVEDYLALRRALGFKLEKPGRLLPDFTGFAEAAGAGTVTIDLALQWAVLPEGASPVWAAQRLSVVRGFARYLQAVDPAAQVPPAEISTTMPGC